MHEPGDNEPMQISGGRSFPYSALGDWVALSGITSHAKAIYWHLSMHRNHQRGDQTVWPTRATLAELCKFEKVQSVGRYIQELIDIGAIDVYTIRNGIKKRNVYTIHEAPPLGYTGVVSNQEFYLRRTSKAITELEAELGKSSVQLPKQFSGSSVVQHRSSVESSVNHDANSDNSGTSSVEEHAMFSKTAAHTVVPWKGLRKSPPGDYGGAFQGTTEVPSRGLKPKEVNKKKLTTTPLAPSNVEIRMEEVELSPRKSTIEMLLSIQVPDGRRAPGRRSEKLMHVGSRIDQLLDSNPEYSLEDFKRHLGVDLDSVTHSVAGVWMHRLRDTELPEPISRPLSAAPIDPCGQCEGRKNEPHSARIKADGSFCQLCHPSVFK